MNPITLNIQVGKQTYPFQLQGYETLATLARGAIAQHGAEFDNGKLRTPSHREYVGDLNTFWGDATRIVEEQRPNPTIRLGHIESLALLATGQMRQIELSKRDGAMALDPVIKTELETIWKLADHYAQEAYGKQAEREA